MEIDSVTCNKCGATNWNKLVSDNYPEQRRERDRTVRTNYQCGECGAEGRVFERGQSGTVQLTGAMRE